jgi:hypothetical protein
MSDDRIELVACALAEHSRRARGTPGWNPSGDWKRKGWRQMATAAIDALDLEHGQSRPQQLAEFEQLRAAVRFVAGSFADGAETALHDVRTGLGDAAEALERALWP